MDWRGSGCMAQAVRTLLFAILCLALVAGIVAIME